MVTMILMSPLLPEAVEGSGSQNRPGDTITGSMFKMCFAPELRIWKVQCVLSSGLQGLRH